MTRTIKLQLEVSEGSGFSVAIARAVVEWNWQDGGEASTRSVSVPYVVRADTAERALRALMLVVEPQIALLVKP